MSEASFNEIVVDEFDGQPKAKSRFDFAQLLRWLGCAGVVLSGIVFLLQGFDDIALALRNWAYLGLMVVLGGVGISLKYVFEDGKGARLLLALAIAMIPIQFAQLGGMIYSLVEGTSNAFPSAIMGLMEWGSVGWGMVVASASATVALAFTVGMFGFRVLARPQARALTLMNLLLAASLLLPFREGVFAVAAFAGLAIATLFADIKLGKANPVLRTGEGRAARFLLLLPLLIAGARASFYVADIGGFAVILGVASVALLVGACHYVGRRGLRELMFFLGSLGVCGAWSIWSLTELGFVDAYQVLSLFAVQGLFLLGMSKLSANGAVYRLIGSLTFAVAVFQFLQVGDGMQIAVTSLGLGVMLSAIGYLQKWRMPAIVGLLIVAVSAFPLTLLALVNVEFGTWLGLAIGGISLVVLASVVERYGRVIRSYAQASWVEVKAWD